MMGHGEEGTLVAAAKTLCAQGRFENAAVLLEQAIAAAPASSVPRAMLGDVLLTLNRPRAAMAAYEAAVHNDPALPLLCRPIDDSAAEGVRCDTVLENCRHILARYPRYAHAHFSRARALLSLGREAEARRAAEQALVLNPTVPAFYHVLIHTGDPERNASAVSSLEQLATVANELPVEDRAILHFLLAKAYEDMGRAADAFDELKKGNAAKRSTIVYDEAKELAKLRAIADAFPPERLARLRGAGTPSELPVFVVGMPRSGTTLIEQILASHPAVFGGGELNLFPDLAGADYPAGELTPEEIGRLGSVYAAKLAALAPDARRIVDKMPYNFLYAGLIHLALPRARIIHVRRDPLDTCFSCFALNFTGDMGFAYDLSELGHYYRAYETLMAHWRAALPPEILLEVRYEDIVADLPGQAKRMIAWCGLEWDARCLDFHKTTRAVATASLHQVRQPLYASSIGRARGFVGQLAPLIDALGTR